MAIIEKLENYKDDKGNVIEYQGAPPTDRVHINFAGHNNKLVVGKNSTIKVIEAKFTSDNGTCILGDVGFAPQDAPNNFSVSFTLGRNCTITVGDFLTTTTWASMTAFDPGSQIIVGRDCMFAGDIRMTTTDWHPYYDVSTKKCLNAHPPPIVLGDHVWVGSFVTIMAGTNIGSGSIAGWGSIIKGKFPNNCTIAGNPAKIRRRNVAWERSPQHFEAYGGNADYWDLTEESSGIAGELNSHEIQKGTIMAQRRHVPPDNNYQEIWAGFIVHNGTLFKIKQRSFRFNDFLDRNFLQLFIEGAHREVHYELILGTPGKLKIALHSEFKNEERNIEMVKDVYANISKLKNKIDKVFPYLPYSLSKVKTPHQTGLSIELPFSCGALHQYNRLLHFFISNTCSYLEQAFIK